MVYCQAQGNNPVVVGFDKFDEEKKERERLRKLSDAELTSRNEGR
jgi:hypothetical protein